jgi:release factor glutamine methyltransferase
VEQTVGFAGAELLTRPGVVMTPRPASVALVERVLAHLGDRPATVADVGTGTGAIAIAIAIRAPQATVWAVDDSEQAVELAERNVRRCGLADRVHVRAGDLLDPVEGQLDAIVANLPYLPQSEREQDRDLADEPEHALYAPGDGLGPYRRLLAAVPDRLAPGGLVALQWRGRVVAARADAVAGLARRLEEWVR